MARKTKSASKKTDTIEETSTQAIAFDEPAPQTPDALHAWIKQRLDITLARTSLIDDHAAPFDYIVHTFFEGAFIRSGPDWSRRADLPATSDCVVWANRGGGKTFLGALATFLDMLFKKAIQIRILAGSLEQSGHMYEHLRTLFDKPDFADLVDGPITSRRITLHNGSRTQILAASQRSVRGTRVHKVRCDEVDLFEQDIWKAAQLTTRSLKRPGPWGDIVRGTVEALSTMQNPYGLMWELVTGERSQITHIAGAPAAPGPRRTLFRWGVVDALESCPPARPCEHCSLFDECAGKAKQRTPAHAGHMNIDDVLAQKSRVDITTWKSEMLCQRPSRSDSVYPEFDPDLHILREGDSRLAARAPVEFVAGMDFGWRAETVVLLASLDRAGTLLIEHEHAAKELTIHDHIQAIQAWIRQGLTRTVDDLANESTMISWIGIDPAGVATNDQTARSNATILRDHSFPVRVVRHPIREGLQAVRTRLAPALADPACTLTINGKRPTLTPRLFIHARCTRLIECLQRYRYTSTDAAAEPCKSDGFDHACDALRYLVACLDIHKPFSRRDY